MSALLNFQTLLAVFLLLICACTYMRMEKSKMPAVIPFPMENTVGMAGFLWKLSRIGERLSPLVSLACFAMGIATLIW